MEEEKQENDNQNQLDQTSKTEQSQQEEKDQKTDEGLDDTTQSSVRTYAGDIAGLIKKGVTLSDVALSEQKRKFGGEKEAQLISEEKVRKERAKKIITAGTAFIILGLLVVGSSFFLKEEDEISDVLEIPSIIFSNSNKEISITDLNGIDTLQKINRERTVIQGPLGNVTNLYLTTGEDMNKRILTAENFLEQIEVRARGSFIRSLENEFMFGIHSFDGNQGFLIFKVSSFDNALPGIIDWEKTMIDDIWMMFYNVKPTVNIEEGAGAGVIQKGFEDELVRNRDTRTLRDSGGNIALIYSFPDRDHIIITSTESTLIEVFDRLTTGRFRN
ncbi:MAG TPA: hypothetical protein QGH03_00690 [Candidatus Paceibacterota bacterium]|jgi:hypothetical protein|nr:hypothetical protein [Parcubacteria group bacterium]MDP6119771.1 hypothetical protein [Candidatus Paceibacterota bacterium]HJN62737.1 hypothetical protein [Candidatus Paceibacterota bacterium]|tara:strand:- start:1855 stop:2844 length:990 start_codon:yes stop_codon:yes gene_type:complete